MKNRTRAKIERRLSRSAQDTAAYAVSRTKYLFVGLSAAAGTTTLAMAFAEYLAQSGCGAQNRARTRTGEGTFFAPAKTQSDPHGARAGVGIHPAINPPARAFSNKHTPRAAYVELNDSCALPTAYDYDRYGMDRHFAGRNYVSFYKLLAEGRSVKEDCNIDGGVNWALRVPGERLTSPALADLTRLYCDIRGENVVGDLNGRYGLAKDNETRIEEIQRILNTADHVIVVVDPGPSAMMSDPDRLILLRRHEINGGKLSFLVNKMNAGVNKKEMSSFLNVRDYAEVPFFPPSEVYAAEYGCRTLMASKSAAETLGRLFCYLL